MLDYNWREIQNRGHVNVIGQLINNIIILHEVTSHQMLLSLVHNKFELDTILTQFSLGCVGVTIERERERAMLDITVTCHTIQYSLNCLKES